MSAAEHENPQFVCEKKHNCQFVGLKIINKVSLSKIREDSDMVSISNDGNLGNIANSLLTDR